MTPLLSGYLSKKRLQAIKPYLSGDILELGCGYSRIPQWLDASQNYVGVDQSPKILIWLEETYPEYDFHIRDIEIDDLNLGGQFDTILMGAVLEHIQNPEGLFAQLANYLKPNGKIVITTPTPFGGWVHTVGSRFGLFYSEAAEEHEKFYNLSAFRSVAEKAGLTMIHYRKFLFWGNQLFVCQA